MAPSTNRTKAHADATKEHRTVTTEKVPKLRLHKRCTVRPKCFRHVRQIEVPECQSITQSPTSRKVSIEELQQVSSNDSREDTFSFSLSNWPRIEDNTTSFIPPSRKNPSSSVQTLVSPGTSPRLLPRSASLPASIMKRRAPSMCLVGLLAQERRNNHNGCPLVTPSSVCPSMDDPTGTTSGGVWGHFVELQHEEGDTLESNQQRRHQQRRPVIRGPHSGEKLEGFFLTLPDVDEAVDQLRNMSF